MIHKTHGCWQKANCLCTVRLPPAAVIGRSSSRSCGGSGSCRELLVAAGNTGTAGPASHDSGHPQFCFKAACFSIPSWSGGTTLSGLQLAAGMPDSCCCKACCSTSKTSGWIAGEISRAGVCNPTKSAPTSNNALICVGTDMNGGGGEGTNAHDNAGSITIPRSITRWLWCSASL